MCINECYLANKVVATTVLYTCNKGSEMEFVADLAASTDTGAGIIRY